jgi:pepF/M3 family oligoendopeptidase
MDQRWNLETLYTSFESPEINEDFNRIQQLLDQLLSTTLGDTQLEPESILTEYITHYNIIGDLISKLYSFGSLNYSVNTSNRNALKLMEQVEKFFPQLTKLEVKFQKRLKDIDLEQMTSKNTLINHHSFFLNELKKHTQYLLSDEEEALIALMKNTGSSAWSKMQQTLTSNLLVDIELNNEQKKLPLSVVRNLAYEKDGYIRKTAYEAELKSYEKIENSSAACLNAIKGEVITLMKQKGYKSPLEMTLLNSRMDKETLDAMMTAIKEYLPTFRHYLKKKSEILGHTNGLPFYDLFAPIGTTDMHYTYESAHDFIVKNFSDFSSKLGSYADHAFKSNWIDAEPREGKVGGAFCDNLHAIKESRIMANFTGSFNDVTTLAHELGHGYHGECLKEVSYINSHYPMPLAETASIFCETIIIHSALKTASKEEALSILENDLMGATQVIVDIYSRFLFESELFKRREDSSIPVEDLKKIMLDAQKEAYGDGLNHDFLHPYMWACKPHYYYADSNFYNYPYAFGLLFAKGLYAKYLDQGEAFIPKYDALLKATGYNSIRDVLEIMAVDSHSVDFFKNSLEIIKQDIDKFCSLA